MKLALTSAALTPIQLRVLADAMDSLEIDRVDIIPQITESRGRWFRLDGELVSGRIVFVEDGVAE